jgi:hypothetical protein
VSSEVTFGQKYRDEITHYQGTATARTCYMNGSIKVCLERPGKDLTPQEAWFEESRLTPVDPDAPGPVGFL